MDIYAKIGVRRRVNAAGSLTRLGGTLMPPEVLDAMRAAAGASVDMAELQEAASGAIARATGAEAGLVTTGAAAALTLGTAACLAGYDVRRMERLPDTTGMPHQVIICRMHRTGYDHAFRAAGARLVEIGFNDRGVGAGVRGVEDWEFEAAIGPETAAIAYVATKSYDPPLDRVVKLAERYKLPVIVDAAAQLPPAQNLRRFIEAGASLVAFSGGKAIRGPQSTGILAGRRDLIASGLLQMLDMDVAPETWSPPPALIARERLNGIPHHGMGRGFKAGKEEIVGLIVALQRFVGIDWDAEHRAIEGRFQRMAQRLGGAGFNTRLVPAAETGRQPWLEVTIDRDRLGLDAHGASRALQAGDPPVHLSERRATDGILVIDPMSLNAADDAVMVERVIALARR
ncbi:MAG: aminotransferase class V-fold PLP-dependent enzyme [Alphaproteobacteria bacterium]|nr:aminotransferase class V-fold PLP-dependent enzyme [Alphaproteobacteria bacterium]